jgi:hypothetical protein
MALSGTLRRDIPSTAIGLVEAKALVGDRPMSSIILPTGVSVYSDFPVQVSLVLNPTNDPLRSPVTNNYYSNFLLSLFTCNAQVNDGVAVATFAVMGSAFHNLRASFSRVRSILAAQFNNPFQIEGSSDFLAVLAQSRLYFVCTPLVPGYTTSLVQPGLALNVEEFNIQYAAGSPPVLLPSIEVNISLFFEDF